VYRAVRCIVPYGVSCRAVYRTLIHYCSHCAVNRFFHTGSGEARYRYGTVYNRRHVCLYTYCAVHQRINLVMDRARRLGYCSPDTPTFEELCDSANDDWFTKALLCLDHLLHPLLPQSSTASQHYNLRHRAHSLQLPEHQTQLSNSNFLTRMLYKNTH